MPNDRLSIFSLTILLITTLAQRSALSYQLAEEDTLLKLAVFPPQAKVFDRPEGELIGYLNRGRVIRLLAAEGKWLNFTTWDFPNAWLRWECTQTLEEWALDAPYDQTQKAILEWERMVKILDAEIDSALAAILDIEQQLSQGEFDLYQGLSALQFQRRKIENSFHALYQLHHPESLNEAAEKLDGKRWAIDQGLNYLCLYIQNGNEEDGASASQYFKLAEEYTVQYSHTIFRLKSKYNLYPGKAKP